MIELPVNAVSANAQNATELIIYGHTKVGKTEALARLPNALIIDLERGSNFVNAMKLSIHDIMQTHKIAPWDALTEIGKSIADANEKAGKPVYDYIIIDTLSALEEFARVYATVLYKQTPLGKTFAGKDVARDLPNGAGWEYVRMAFEAMIKPLRGKAKRCLIFCAHVKDSSINKQGMDLKAKDISLTGKLKLIMASKADAIGFVYRNPKNVNQTLISFKTHEQDLATGARPPHLSNQEFVLLELTNPDYAEKNEPKIFIDNWDKIFI